MPIIHSQQILIEDLQLLAPKRDSHLPHGPPRRPLAHPTKYMQCWPPRGKNRPDFPNRSAVVQGRPSVSEEWALLSSATPNQTRRWRRVTLQRSTRMRFPWLVDVFSEVIRKKQPKTNFNHILVPTRKI